MRVKVEWACSTNSEASLLIAVVYNAHGRRIYRARRHLPAPEFAALSPADQRTVFAFFIDSMGRECVSAVLRTIHRELTV